MAAVAAVCFATAAHAQLRPPSGGAGVGDYTLHDFAAKWMMQQDDIAELRKYREANRALLAENDPRRRIVFIGDSITEIWSALQANSDTVRRWVNRGIGGSNTSQMLLRFEDDAVALGPETVVIMGGTNDLRAYVGTPASVSQGAFERVTRNVMAMSDIADARGIRVVLCGIPPVGRDLEKVARDPEGVRRINRWLAEFALKRGYVFVEYASALADRDGFMAQAFSDDGIHPNAAGYAVMMPLLKASLARSAHEGTPPLSKGR